MTALASPIAPSRAVAPKAAITVCPAIQRGRATWAASTGSSRSDASSVRIRNRVWTMYPAAAIAPKTKVNPK